MRRILFWITLGFFTLFVATAAWLWTAEFGVFKPQLEDWITEATGREFAIDGDFSVDLARQTTVVATDVRFANPEWVGTQQMARIGRAEIRVDTRSLWKRPVVIELIEIEDAEVVLAGREDGAPNWVLEDTKPSQVAKEDAAILPVLFKRIDVNRLHLVADSPGRTRPLDIRIQSFNEVHRVDDMLEFSVNAKVNDRPVFVTAEVGGWMALLAGADVRYKLDARLDTFELTSDGWIDNLDNIRRPNFRFEANGPDINDLVRLLGLEEEDESEGDINISGSLTAANDKPLLLDVEGNLGLLQIEASGSLSDLEKFEEVDIDAQADSPNLGRLLGFFGIDQVGEAPFHLDVEASRKGSTLIVRKAEMLFGDATFNFSATMPSFPAFHSSNISLDVEGPDLERFRELTGLPGRAAGKFTVRANIDTSPDGGNEVQVDLATSLGVLEAQGILTNAAGHIGSQLDLKVSGNDLALLGSAYGLSNLPDKPFEISGSVALEQGGLRTTQPVVARVNDITLRLDGRAALNPGLQGSDFDFNLAGPDLAVLLGAFGPDEYVPNEPYDVTGKLQVRENGLGIHGLTATVGTSNIRIEGLLVPSSGLYGSTIAIDASGPAFEEIVDQVGQLEIAAGRYVLSGKIDLLEDVYRFDDVRFERDRGELLLDLEIGQPASRNWIKFDLRAQGTDIRTLFDGSGRIKLNETPYSIVARGERDGELWSIDNMTLDAGDVNLRAAGELALGADKASSLFRFRGSIPDLSNVGTIDGRLMRQQSMSWDAMISSSDGELRMNDVALRIGDSEINGSLLYKPGIVPEFDIELLSDSFELAAFLEEPVSVPDSEQPQSNGRLIPDIAVPFEAMKKLNATLRVRIGELRRGDLTLFDAYLNANLRGGRLDVHDAGFRGRSGTLVSHAKVDPAQGAGGVSADIVAKDVNLGTTNWNLNPEMTWSATINIDAAGNDLRTLLGNTDGVVFVDIRRARTDNTKRANLLYGDLLGEIVGALMPTKETSSFTQYDCIITPAKIDNGIVTLEPNAFVQTDKLRVAAKSRINLGTEGLDVAIQTTPRRGVGISAGQLINPFIKITGTLAKPRLSIDEQGVIFKGGAAVATGGLSLVATGLWDRIKRTDDACGESAKAGRESLHDRFPTSLTNDQ
ncbi:MAG: AsmA family protein [Gammaproteobacteria bacterium]|nr:AsmA family protein [Gammaproteobacteria bacterium]